MELIIDTREQNPLKFRLSKNITEIKSQKLDVGDYSVAGYETKIAIERKNPLDLFGTTGKGHERFKREIDRAKEYDYFAIIVEAPYSQIKDKTFKQSFRTKMRGDVVTKIIWQWMFKYNIHMHFANDEKEAARMVRDILLNYVRYKENGNI